MVILHAELQVNGHATPLTQVEFALMQATDYQGRPSSTVRIQPLRLTFTGQAVALAFFAQWGLDSFLRRSGRVVFYGEQNQVVKTISFFEAHCVLYQAALHPDVQGQAALTLTLALSPAAIDHQGQHVESHSLLPWAAPAATRRRVLTSPADLLPSPGLRAATHAAVTAPKFKASRRLNEEEEDDKEGQALNDKEQMRIVKQALHDLNSLLAARLSALKRWNGEDQAAFKNAFGSTDEEDRLLIEARVERMSALVDEYLTAATFKRSFRAAKEESNADGEAVAFAYPNDEEHTVYLCPPFWRRPATGPNSRAEVLAHELSHFDDVGPTEDHKYDLEDCAELVSEKPADALENVDNFAHYVGGTTLPDVSFT